MSKPWMEPQSVSKVCELAASLWREGDVGVLATGHYSPAPDAIRVGVCWVRGDCLAVAADAYISESDRVLLQEQLSSMGPLRLGMWDTMAATEWTLVWTHDNLPFSLWDRKGVRAIQRVNDLVLRGRWGRTASVPRAEMIAVEAFVEPGWVRRGVRVLLGAEEERVLAEASELIALIDPTYDGIDLTCDAAWTGNLARAVGRAFELPVRYSDELLG